MYCIGCTHMGQKLGQGFIAEDTSIPSAAQSVCLMLRFDWPTVFRLALAPWCTRRTPRSSASPMSTRRTRASSPPLSPTSTPNSTRASRGSGVVVSWASRPSASWKRGRRPSRPSSPRRLSTDRSRSDSRSFLPSQHTETWMVFDALMAFYLVEWKRFWRED